MKALSPSILSRWLIRGEWRHHFWRNFVATLAIALGVALGFSIYLINNAAFSEFSAAVRHLSGQADLQLRASQAVFDEALYARIAKDALVDVASPVLELDISPAGKKQALKILGLDALLAARVTPELTGVAEEGRFMDAFADNAIFLSPAAMEWLNVAPGGTVRLQARHGEVQLRVAGSIRSARAGQRLAVMDIGAMQWRFDQLGDLSRLDLRLQPGVSRENFTAHVAREYGNTFQLIDSAQQETRAANMSRAYRVNLNMLALVALFTGAFLVFSNQALSVVRRRSELALLRVLGLTRTQLLRHILSEGALVGACGSLLGLAAGYLMATLALRIFGGDLGGGYFPGIVPHMQFSTLVAAVFFLLGTGIALLGCAAPAWQAATTHPASALKNGGSDVVLNRLTTPWIGLALLALAAVCSQLPPVSGIPVFGYLAIGLMLIGAIFLMPRVAASVFGQAQRAVKGSTATLALAHLANAPNQASIALGGVLTSFSLMVAMAIMVASFRISVDQWLDQVLDADVFLRTPGAAATMPPDKQRLLATINGIERIAFQRTTRISLDPTRAEVPILAREIDINDPARAMPLLEADESVRNAQDGAIPIWISEAMIDLYRFEIGQRLSLPIGPRDTEFIVAGVWRDYIRQTGAIQMRLQDYRTLSGDLHADEAAIWFTPDTALEAVLEQVRALSFGKSLEVHTPTALRTISMRIFDRSFAVTYLLEFVAVVIGLFGIAASFSAQTLARKKEFGMLRHIGLTRSQILHMLSIEGGLLAALGVALGLALGAAISLVLVFVINPQSFHWSMEWHPPWLLVAGIGALLFICAALTAVLAGRAAVSTDVVRAVREDW